MRHLLETSLSVTVAGTETEFPLAVWFNVIPGYPADRIDPGQPDTAEITEAYVGKSDESKDNACPPWLWLVLVESEDLQAEMLECARDAHEAAMCDRGRRSSGSSLE